MFLLLFNVVVVTAIVVIVVKLLAPRIKTVNDRKTNGGTDGQTDKCIRILKNEGLEEK